MKMEAEAAVTWPQAQEGREPAGLTGRMASLLGPVERADTWVLGFQSPEASSSFCCLKPCKPVVFVTQTGKADRPLQTSCRGQATAVHKGPQHTGHVRGPHCGHFLMVNSWPKRQGPWLDRGAFCPS